MKQNQNSSWQQQQAETPSRSNKKARDPQVPNEEEAKMYTTKKSNETIKPTEPQQGRPFPKEDQNLPGKKSAGLNEPREGLQSRQPNAQEPSLRSHEELQGASVQHPDRINPGEINQPETAVNKPDALNKDKKPYDKHRAA